MRILVHAGLLRGQRTTRPTPAAVERPGDVVAAVPDDDDDLLRGFYVTGLLSAPAQVTR